MIIEAAENGNDLSMTREYTEAERALNAYIRLHFPEWEAKDISAGQ